MSENDLNGVENVTPEKKEAVPEAQNYYYENPQVQQPVYQGQAVAEAAQEGSKGLAIASMVCGICSIVLCCLSWVDAIIAVVGLVLGIVSKVKKMGGKGMSTAGIICSVVGLLLVVLFYVLLILGVASAYMTGDFSGLANM